MNPGESQTSGLPISAGRSTGSTAAIRPSARVRQIGSPVLTFRPAAVDGEEANIITIFARPPLAPLPHGAFKIPLRSCIPLLNGRSLVAALAVLQGGSQ